MSTVVPAELDAQRTFLQFFARTRLSLRACVQLFAENSINSYKWSNTTENQLQMNEWSNTAENDSSRQMQKREYWILHKQHYHEVLVWQTLFTENSIWSHVRAKKLHKNVNWFRKTTELHNFFKLISFIITRISVTFWIEES